MGNKIKKIGLLYRTVRDVKPKQIIFRIVNKFKKSKVTDIGEQANINLSFPVSIASYKSLINESTFRFLNIEHQFNEINWNENVHGKLWTYNLNYFDFLNQEYFSKEKGLVLIDDYINKYNSLKDGVEPYPISLRLINWIKFCLKHNIYDSKINKHISYDAQHLMNKVEYHLLGNHLLENSFALLFASYYFQNDTYYKKARVILKKELKEQFLLDGANFELSPMYHNILLYKLLDCYQLVKLNPWKDDELLDLLTETCTNMLGWARSIQFKDGSFPMVNDSAFDIAPNNKLIFEYANELNLSYNQIKLEDSGYRKIDKNNFELLIDVGNIGPDYIPGHAHADTFNFLLNINGKPFITEVGTSTYEKNQLRHDERSTSSHNTVEINGENQSEVWGGFRVGRKAKIKSLKELENKITAEHNGYKHIGYIHNREFEFENDIIITDKIFGNQPSSKAFLHFHPAINNLELKDSVITTNKVSIHFKGDIKNIVIVDYQYANGFNSYLKGKKAVIEFTNELETTIKL